MTVTFGLVQPGGVVIEEDALPGWLAENPGGVKPNGEQDGMLQLAPPGAEPVRLFDWIGPLVQSVCLALPADLLDGGRAEISLYTVDEDYEATPDGADVLLSGRRIPGMRVPRAELLPALVACAERYVALMRPAAAAQGWADTLDGTAARAADVRAWLEGRPPAPRPVRPDDSAGADGTDA